MKIFWFIFMTGPAVCALSFIIEMYIFKGGRLLDALVPAIYLAYFFLLFMPALIIPLAIYSFSMLFLVGFIEEKFEVGLSRGRCFLTLLIGSNLVGTIIYGCCWYLVFATPANNGQQFLTFMVMPTCTLYALAYGVWLIKKHPVINDIKRTEGN